MSEELEKYPQLIAPGTRLVEQPKPNYHHHPTPLAPAISSEEDSGPEKSNRSTSWIVPWLQSRDRGAGLLSRVCQSGSAAAESQRLLSGWTRSSNYRSHFWRQFSKLQWTPLDLVDQSLQHRTAGITTIPFTLPANLPSIPINTIPTHADLPSLLILSNSLTLVNTLLDSSTFSNLPDRALFVLSTVVVHEVFFAFNLILLSEPTWATPYKIRNTPPSSTPSIQIDKKSINEISSVPPHATADSPLLSLPSLPGDRDRAQSSLTLVFTHLWRPTRLLSAVWMLPLLCFSSTTAHIYVVPVS